LAGPQSLARAGAKSRNRRQIGSDRTVSPPIQDSDSSSTIRCYTTRPLGGGPDMAADESVESLIRERFAEAGVTLEGNNAWDIHVHDPRFFKRVFSQQSLGLGESYMDGWWDVERLDLLFERLYRRDLHNRGLTWRHTFHFLKSRLFNMQRPDRAYQVGKVHYDVGNDLYKIMLGPQMIYSSCCWKSASTLAEAEHAKLDLICRKLDLSPGMKLLDLRSGSHAFP